MLKKLFLQIKSHLQNLNSNQWTFILALLFIAAGVGLRAAESPPGIPPSEVKEDSSPADTFIPRHHVLIPIEVSNHESLNALVGAFALVDLFTLQKDSQEGRSIRKGRKVASHVKLIRAPLNPQKFAVLVHERQSDPIVSHQDAFFVTVQNRETDSPTEVHPATQLSRSANPEINYQN